MYQAIELSLFKRVTSEFRMPSLGREVDPWEGLSDYH